LIAIAAYRLCIKNQINANVQWVSKPIIGILVFQKLKCKYQGNILDLIWKNFF